MLGALLKRAALLVSNDSGPVHIASAVGTPVVSIFGRYEPGLGPVRWRPLGKNSRVVAKDVSRIPAVERKFTYIDEITVEEVYAAAHDLLTHSVREMNTGCVKSKQGDGS
jgi:ADP-heptose:LPS heptosyltransferase